MVTAAMGDNDESAGWQAKRLNQLLGWRPCRKGREAEPRQTLRSADNPRHHEVDVATARPNEHQGILYIDTFTL